MVTIIGFFSFYIYNMKMDSKPFLVGGMNDKNKIFCSEETVNMLREGTEAYKYFEEACLYLSRNIYMGELKKK